MADKYIIIRVANRGTRYKEYDGSCPTDTKSTFRHMQFELRDNLNDSKAKSFGWHSKKGEMTGEGDEVTCSGCILEVPIK